MVAKFLEKIILGDLDYCCSEMEWLLGSFLERRSKNWSMYPCEVVQFSAFTDPGWTLYINSFFHVSSSLTIIFMKESDESQMEKHRAKKKDADKNMLLLFLFHHYTFIPFHSNWKEPKESLGRCHFWTWWQNCIDPLNLLALKSNTSLPHHGPWVPSVSSFSLSIFPCFE